MADLLADLPQERTGALLTLVTLFNALLWRELPVPHPEELAFVAG